MPNQKYTFSTLILETAKPLNFSHTEFEAAPSPTNPTIYVSQDYVFNLKDLNIVKYSDPFLTFKSGQLRFSILSDESRGSNECKLRAAARKKASELLDLLKGLRRLA